MPLALSRRRRHKSSSKKPKWVTEVIKVVKELGGKCTKEKGKEVWKCRIPDAATVIISNEEWYFTNNKYISIHVGGEVTLDELSMEGKESILDYLYHSYEFLEELENATGASSADLSIPTYMQLELRFKPENYMKAIKTLKKIVKHGLWPKIIIPHAELRLYRTEEKGESIEYHTVTPEEFIELLTK